MAQEKDRKSKSKSDKLKKLKGHSGGPDTDASTSTKTRLAALQSRTEPESRTVDTVEADDNQDSESDSESDQIEDEEGDLVTPEIDQGINSVLDALRKNNTEMLKDSKLSFFPEIGAEGTGEAREAKRPEKPLYLKDYQRETLLSGAALEEDDEDEQPRPAPGSYRGQQEADRAELLKEIHAQEVDGGEEEDDLLQKRTTERAIPEVELPDPEKDADGFLSAFISNKAWIKPAKKDNKPTYTEVVGEDENEDDDEFDDLSEKFESAYNFRFEDPASAEIVSYARDQSTLRRGKLSSRQKKREREKEEREKDDQQKKLEMAKLRKAKVNQVSDKLSQLYEAVGEDEIALAQKLSAEDLDGDWDNDEWDRRMQKLFDDEYYGRDGGKLENDTEPRQLEDIGEDAYDDENALEHDTVEEPIQADLPRKLSRKDLKRKAEQFVDGNQDLLLEETIKPQHGFRYRQVEPESFGLTTRDILLASDKELNQFVGLKKLASYREKDRVEKDRKRYAKRKRLRDWRKTVFGSEMEPTDELWEERKKQIGDAGLPESKRDTKHKHKSKKRKH